MADNVPLHFPMPRAILGLFLATLSFASGTVPASYLASLPPGAAPRAVATDSAGSILIAGQITPPGAADSATDAFVSKLTSAGVLVYFKQFGGALHDTAAAIAADSAGNAYITGTTASGDFPTTTGAWQMTFTPTDTSQVAGFVAKVSPTGSIVYSTLLLNGNGAAIAVNDAGEAFVTGYAIPGAFGNAQRYFILRLAAAGDHFVFSVLGPGGTSIALDKTNIYVAGTDPDQGGVPTTAGAFQQHGTPSGCGGGAQLQIPCFHQYVCKMDIAGTKLAFCTFVSGTSGDANAGLNVDPNGDIWLAGGTTSNDYPVTPDAAQPKNTSTAPPYPINPPLYPGIYQYFPLTGYLTKLAGDGTHLLYSSYLGGSQHDEAVAMALDDMGLYISASVDSPDLPGLPSAPQRCLPSRLHNMPVLLRIDPATHVIVSETVVEGTPRGGALLAVDGQRTATLIAGLYAARVPQVSTAIFDAIVCIVDAADFTQAAPVAPGQVLSIFGSSLGPSAPVVYDPNSPALPTTLGGISILTDNGYAPLLYASDTQINFVAPYEFNGSPTSLLRLTRPSRISAYDVLSQRLLVAAPLGPGLLTFGNTDYPACNGYGLYNSTSAAVYNQDGSINSCTNPAAPGSRVSLVLNGSGLLAPQVADAYNTVEAVMPVPGQPLGVWQVYVRLSANTRGYAYSSLKVFGMPAREQNVAIWVM